MSQDELDPVIHAPARLRLMVTLAALRDGDTLSFTRLKEMIGLSPGTSSGSGVNAVTAVSLTRDGRTALDRYRTVLRQLREVAEPAEQK